jgi:hypothetical protein
MRYGFCTIVVILAVAVCVRAEEVHPYDAARGRADETMTQWKTQYAGNADVLVLDYVLADRKAGSVILLACGTGLEATSLLEFFVVTADSGKDYESLAVTWAKPSDIHKALAFIGLKPGRPVQFDNNYFWSRGPRVTATIDVVKEDVAKKGVVKNAEIQSVRIEDFVIGADNQTLPHDGFIFAGSYTHTDENGKTFYAADVMDTRPLLPNYNDPAAVLDVPTQAPQSVVYGSQRLNPQRLLQQGAPANITLRPADKAEQITSRDIQIQMSVDAQAVRYTLHESTTTLAGPNDLPGLTAAVSKIADGKTDLFTTVSVAADVPVDDVRKLYVVLQAVEKNRGVKLDPPGAGELFHRAFFPDNAWRDRATRLGEPWELFLSHTPNGLLTGRLERLVDNYEPEATEKQTLQTFDVASPDAFLKTVNDNQSQWSKAIFIYPPTDLTYGQLMQWARPALPTYPRIFVFTTVTPNVAPATQPAE